MNAGVPETVPSTVSPSTDASAAMPKSTSTTRPFGVTRTFDGFRSRWTMPASWSACNACASWPRPLRSRASSSERGHRHPRMLARRAHRAVAAAVAAPPAAGTSTLLVIAAVDRSDADAGGARHPGGRT